MVISRTWTVGSLDTEHALKFEALARLAGVLGGWVSARAWPPLYSFTAVCWARCPLTPAWPLTVNCQPFTSYLLTSFSTVHR